MTIQAQILDLLRELQRKMGMAILFISHDLGVIAELADEVVVMYAGRVVERGPGRTISSTQPLHPYTRGLLRSIPGWAARRRTSRLDSRHRSQPARAAEGCPFRPRCPGSDASLPETPALLEVEPGSRRAAGCTRRLLTAKVGSRVAERTPSRKRRRSGSQQA